MFIIGWTPTKSASKTWSKQIMKTSTNGAKNNVVQMKLAFWKSCGTWHRGHCYFVFFLYVILREKKRWTFRRGWTEIKKKKNEQQNPVECWSIWAKWENGFFSLYLESFCIWLITAIKSDLKLWTESIYQLYIDFSSFHFFFFFFEMVYEFEILSAVHRMFKGHRNVFIVSSV